MLDFRSALICAVIANVNRNPKKRHSPFKPSDFMPRREEQEPEKQFPEQMLQRIKIMNAALGGKVREK